MKTINVTQEHIRKGQHCSAADCPVALGLLAAGYSRVIVGRTHFSYDGDKRIRRKLPAKVQRFIKDFDAGKKVEPFEFRLKV